MHEFDSKYVFSTSSVKYTVENERSRKSMIPLLKAEFLELFLELISCWLLQYFVCHLSLKIAHFEKLNIQRYCHFGAIHLEDEIAFRDELFRLKKYAWIAGRNFVLFSTGQNLRTNCFWGQNGFRTDNFWGRNDFRMNSLSGQNAF